MPKKPEKPKAKGSSVLAGTIRGGWLDGKKIVHVSGGKQGQRGGYSIGKAGVAGQYPKKPRPNKGTK